MKFGVIGGGLLGLSTARALRRAAPSADIALFEKEPDFGRHQSTHNSGVLHCGLYYKPGSAKARLAVSGIRQMVAFCREHGVAHETCGKLVVAVGDQEEARLRLLFERGRQNGLAGLRWLGPEELREIEPHAAGQAAVHVPEEGIVDYAAVVTALVRENRAAGSELLAGARVERLVPERSGWRVISSAGERNVDFLVNCAGLHCDRVAARAGEVRQARIVPFRGEYYQLRPERTYLVRNLIYPVPDARFPFLGVHFTRLIHGGIEAGPNAVLALAREGYRKTDFNLRDSVDALGFPGLWRFLGRHRTMCWDELRRSFSRRLFCLSLQKLVPDIRLDDLQPGGAGVRAQAMTADGGLVEDFELITRPNALHVLNAPSPAATASLAIGDEIARRVLDTLAYAAPSSPA